jgi:YggT family protein
VVFDAVSEVRLFILVFISVYTLVLFAYVITSWVQLPYSLRGVQTFLYEVCEPYLRLWRRVLPSFGPLDLSPMVAIFALVILGQIVVALLDRLH